jgi:hypothetical protein
LRLASIHTLGAVGTETDIPLLASLGRNPLPPLRAAARAAFQNLENNLNANGE